MISTLILTTLICAPVNTPAFYANLDQAVLTDSVDRLKAVRKQVQNEFDSLEKASPETLYMVAYVNWRLNHALRAIPSQDDERETLLEEAKTALERLIVASPQDGEAHALLGSVLGELIDGNMFRGMTLGPRAGKLHQKAKALAPNNPRVALLAGIRAVFTPSMFGGGLEIAKAELERAHQLFAAESVTAPWPNWGRIDVYAWRGQVAAKMDKPAEAKALYEEALERAPTALWIRHVLLPAVR